jgi:hypothetical protein
MNEHPQAVKMMQTRLISATKYFSVLEMKDGEVFIETEAIDDEDITLCEVLRSKDRTHFTLVGRCRHGANHHEMRSYPRDNDLPLFSVVKLDAEPF